MTVIRGIVVHQTGAKTAQSSLNSYLNAGANGAHFLIDKDGTIYQTGSVYWIQWHVGKIRARCLAELRCTPVEVAKLKKMGVSAINKSEMTKSVPDRYPSNQDSIGIELVGGTIGSGNDPLYEAVTKQQNASLSWLVSELQTTFKVPLTEVFRHPQVSYKDPHEAETAKW
ncbi:peptidoglycan recognition protein family protein [Acetobacter nitrogenifigens]|nr:peptidoglycan recognition family protein [Acetobacter nitrogenifigens]